MGVLVAKSFSVVVNEFQRWRRNAQSFESSRTSNVEGSSSSSTKEKIEEISKKIEYRLSGGGR